jgi:ATP-binding cassette subfamily B protein
MAGKLVFLDGSILSAAALRQMRASRKRGQVRSDPAERWISRLAGYCWHYRRCVLVALGGAVLSTVVTAIIPLVQRGIIDNAILARRQPIWMGALLLLAAAVAGFGAAAVRRYHVGRLSLMVQRDLRSDLFRALTRLDGARQDQLHTGQVVSRSISDLALVQGLLAPLPVLFGNALQFILAVAFMAFLSPLLTVIALAVRPAVGLTAYRSRHQLFPATWEEQQQAANVVGVVEGAITGVRVVKGFGQEEQEIERVEEASSWLYASRVRAVRMLARYNPALQAVPALGQVGVLLLGCWLAIRGSISIGTFFAFSAYLLQMAGPIRLIAAVVTTGQEVQACVLRVYEIIDARPAMSEPADPEALPAGPLGLELKRVTFGYRAGDPVLRDLSLRVRPGETLALVGTSGAGKSTVPLLLARFYDVQQGAVLVGGHNVRNLSPGSLRSAICLVLQDGFLFSDTVRANIAYGRPDATEAQVAAAARAAWAPRATEFIAELPDGLDTVIGEQGLSLSGGQRQRIALARALITEPPILVLDDATSAIDATVEAQIHAGLAQTGTGQTRLLIAHRRSTLRLADRIAVLHDGHILDEGTDAELRARCPVYRSLVLAAEDEARAAGQTVAAVRREVAPGAVGNGQAPQRRRDVMPGLWGRDGPARRPGAGPAPGSLRRHRRPSSGRSRALNLWPARARGRPRQRGTVAGMLADVPPSPELLARVAALPPANDVPAVSRRWARAPAPGFTLPSLLKPFAVAATVALILDALDTLAGIAMPALVRNGVENGVLERAFRTVVIISLIALAIVAADWAVNVVQTRVVGRTGERLLYVMRIKVFAHLQRLGLAFYEQERTGRIMTRMTTDIDALSSFLQNGLVTMATSGLSLVGVMAALLLINLRLGLVLAVAVALLAVVTLKFHSVSARIYRQSREDIGAVNADLQENVAGLRVIQAYRRERHNLARLTGLGQVYLDSRLQAQRYIALYFPFVQALSTLGSVIVLLTASTEVRGRALTAGALIAYLLYIDLLFSPIQQLSQVFDGYQQANVGLQRIKTLLRMPIATRPPPVPVTRLRGHLEIRDVRFSYPGQRRESVAGVSFSVAPGETVALVGETGAGKSTLVKLIARFYDVGSGQILVDGVDIRDYDLPGYRHQLGYVPQEPYLFPGTIRDAIAYGRPDATDAEIEAAARGVDAIGIIARLPGGFGYEVSERGRNLSAGQRQLIALARAYLVNPSVLLLDEATAALDLATEAAVTRATQMLEARRTTIMVAHRLVTAVRADRIVVIGGGRVIETGTHTELLAARGSYAAMWPPIRVTTWSRDLVSSSAC